MSKITQKNKKGGYNIEKYIGKKTRRKEECKQKKELLEVNITEKSNIIN